MPEHRTTIGIELILEAFEQCPRVKDYPGEELDKIPVVKEVVFDSEEEVIIYLDDAGEEIKRVDY